jgi:hypothetical protein
VKIVVRRARAADFESLAQEGAPLLFDHAFVERLSAASGYRNVSLALERRGRRFVLPVLRRRAARIYPIDFSLPFGHHGSLFPEPEDSEEYAALLVAAKRKLGTGLVLQNVCHGVLVRARIPVVASHVSHILVTRGTSYDRVFKETFDAKLRNQIRKAEKSSLDVMSGNGIELFRKFHELYLLSNERWGKETPKYSLRFFETFAGAPFVDVKLAVFEGRPIAGIVLLKFRDQIMYWFGSMDKAYATKCPNHLLISRALKDAIAEDRGMFNFGVSGTLESVRKFKESFGAEARAYRSHFVGNPLLGALLRRRMRDA